MERIELTERESEAVSLGLSSAEVEEQRQLGNVNISTEKAGKSYLRIIGDNLFTYFNMIWAVVAVILISVGSFQNLTFLAVVIPNILIATVQEIRAKRTVEKLSVTTDPRAVVIRDGQRVEIDAKEIVLGDVMFVEIGHQILSDGVVLSGYAEANESMLTGESDAIKKQAGDSVLAGSYLVSGAVYVKVTAVGKDNYVHKIEKSAKSFKAPQSNLFRDLNSLIKYIGILMVPMTVFMVINNWDKAGGSVKEMVEATSGSVIGMIPAGAYLLVTLALTLSVILLAKKNTLVQDMYSIEMLAAADVVCLDKTGTITDGTMQVSEIIPLEADEDRIAKVMAMLEGSEDSINNTSRALIDKFGKNTECKIIEKIPFSSSRKYSAVKIDGEGVFAIGAPHFVKCPVSEEMDQIVAERARRGERVLLLCEADELDSEGKPLALIALSDRIRPNAEETIKKFQDQGVTVKVISGDHAATVSAIAARVGIKDADKYLSCEGMSDDELLAVANDYAVYGRVTPEQKVLLVKALKKAGHTVAMTGDGVNDTLALKESDCSVAMAEGSEMAKKVSKIVLLNSDFGSLPEVVREGRKCINNVRMSATLFLMKTIFTVVLSVLAIVIGVLYPIQSKHLSLLELLVIGLGSLLLTVEPNEKRIEGSFLKTVLVKSVPNAIAMIIPVFTLLILHKVGVIANTATVGGIAAFTIITVGLINLIFLCRPYTKWRVGVVGLVSGLLAVAIPIVTFLMGDMLDAFAAFEDPRMIIYTLILGVAVALIIHIGMSLLSSFKKKKKASASAENAK